MTLTVRPAARLVTMSAIDPQIDSSCTVPHLPPRPRSRQGPRPPIRPGRGRALHAAWSASDAEPLADMDVGLSLAALVRAARPDTIAVFAIRPHRADSRGVYGGSSP